MKHATAQIAGFVEKFIKLDLPDPPSVSNSFMSTETNHSKKASSQWPGKDLPCTRVTAFSATSLFLKQTSQQTPQTQKWY